VEKRSRQIPRVGEFGSWGPREVRARLDMPKDASCGREGRRVSEGLLARTLLAQGAIPFPYTAGLVETRVDRWRALALLALMSAAGLGCSRQPDAAEAASLPLVTVTTVDQGPVSDLLLVSGTLEPPPGKSAKLGVLVPGRLSELNVAEGDNVHRGQLLARLEPTPFRDTRAQAEAALQQARAQAMNARQHLARAVDLWDAGAGPLKDVEDAQAQVASAESAVKTNSASVSLALNQATRGEVVAPMDGVVSHLYAAVGEPMDGSGKPILEVAQVEVLELQGGAPPGRAGRLAPGQPAEVAASGDSRMGAVRAVSPAVDPASGLVRVRVQVPNPEARLKVGVTAEARILLRLIPDAVRVPLGALIPSGPGSMDASVNVVTDDGHARRQKVEVGVKDTAYAEVISGLAAGNRVILSGSYSLPDGAAVQVADGGSRSEKP
jgi:RND family efflux transporter MFP subunit